MTILLTGGTGYVGSHTAASLLHAGHAVVLLDNCSNSSPSVVGRLEQLTGQAVPFVEGDVRDTVLVNRLLLQHRCSAVLHFAGLKAVGESVQRPLDYYDNNIGGTLSLLDAMRASGVRTLVFSSSATVYGDPAYLPIDEAHPLRAVSPYGRSKLHVEEMLRDLSAADPAWRLACLRYFNPAGAHSSGLLGEAAKGVPNNLMPSIAQVASGQAPSARIFGGDYPTPDGTGVRDFIHVEDLADGHLAALGFLRDNSGWHAINLGTGRGHSVLDVFKAFERASGKALPREIVQRRAGDVASSYASAAKAERVLGWRATRGLEEMCATAWKWHVTHQSDTGDRLRVEE